MLEVLITALAGHMSCTVEDIIRYAMAHLFDAFEIIAWIPSRGEVPRDFGLDELHGIRAKFGHGFRWIDSSRLGDSMSADEIKAVQGFHLYRPGNTSNHSFNNDLLPPGRLVGHEFVRRSHVIVSMSEPTEADRKKCGAVGKDSAIFLDKDAIVKSGIELIRVDVYTCICQGRIPHSLVSHLRTRENRVIQDGDPKSVAAGGGFACGQGLSTAQSDVRDPRSSGLNHQTPQRTHSPPVVSPEGHGKKIAKRTDEAKERREDKQNVLRASWHPKKWDSDPTYRIKMSFMGATRENFLPGSVDSWIAVDANSVPPGDVSDEVDDTAYEEAD